MAHVIRGLVAVLSLLCTNSCSVHSSSLKSVDANAVVGTWELISDDFRRPNGEIIPFPGLGPEVKGLLIYDSTGHMMVHIMAVERPMFTGLRDVPCEDLRAALRGYRGYFGTYHVDATKHEITHRVLGSPFPSLPGQVFTRSFTLNGDELLLQAPEAANGEQGTALIKWRRVKRR